MNKQNLDRSKQSELSCFLLTTMFLPKPHQSYQPVPMRKGCQSTVHPPCCELRKRSQMHKKAKAQERLSALNCRPAESCTHFPEGNRPVRLS